MARKQQQPQPKRFEAPPGASPQAVKWIGGVAAPAVWLLVALAMAVSFRDGLGWASLGWIAGGVVFLGIALFLHARHFWRATTAMRRAAPWGELVASALSVGGLLFLVLYALKRMIFG